MSKLDREIREALLAGEPDEIRELGEEQGVFEMMGDVFRGRRRWLTILAYIYTLVFMVVGVYGVFQLIEIVDLQGLAIWGFVVFFSFQAVAMLKMWFWMEMERNTLSREILRLELRIVELGRKIEASR